MFQAHRFTKSFARKYYPEPAATTPKKGLQVVSSVMHIPRLDTGAISAFDLRLSYLAILIQRTLDRAILT